MINSALDVLQYEKYGKYWTGRLHPEVTSLDLFHHFRFKGNTLITIIFYPYTSITIYHRTIKSSTSNIYFQPLSSTLVHQTGHVNCLRLTFIHNHVSNHTKTRSSKPRQPPMDAHHANGPARRHTCHTHHTRHGILPRPS